METYQPKGYHIEKEVVKFETEECGIKFGIFL